MSLFVISFFSSLCVVISSLCIIGFVIWKKSSKKYYLLFNGSIAVWSSLYCLWFFAQTEYEFLLFARVLLISIITIPFFYLKFCCEISEYEEPKWVSITSAAFLCLFIRETFTSTMIRGVFSIQDIAFWPDPGPLFPLYLAFFGIHVTYGFYILHKKSSSILQLRYVLLGSFLGFFGGATNFFIWYKIPIPSYGNFLVVLYILILGYAIVKHKLLDISVVINRTTAFGITVILFSILYALPVFGYKLLISHHINLTFLLLTMGINTIICGRYFEKCLIKIQTYTSKAFIKEAYETEQLVHELSEQLASSKTRFDALKTTCTTLALHIEFPHAVIIHQEWNEKSWNVHFLWTMDPTSPAKVLESWEKNHPIFDLIKNFSTPFLITSSIEKTPFPINSLVVPVFRNNQLESILVLAPKLSEKGYTQQELSLFSAISIQIGIVLDKIYHQQELESLNQKLFELNITLEKRVQEEIEIKKKAIHTAQELSHKASLSTLSLGIAHEIRNPMTALKGHSGLLKKYLVTKGWKKGVVQASPAHLSLLQKENLIDEDYILDDSIDMDDPDFQLDFDAPPAKIIELRHYIEEAWLQKKILQFCDLIDTISIRIVKIADTMLKYGIANSNIKPHLFSKIPNITLELTEKLWNNLITKGYIDDNGTILSKFSPEKPSFQLDLDPEFQSFAPDIQQILMNTPGAIKQKINLNKVVEDVLELIEGQCKKKRIKLHSNCQHVPDIWGDENRLHQACFNILLNGIQALASTPPASRELHVSLTWDENNVYLAIKDNGCGIPEEHLSKIQTPFFTTKNPKGGQNVGLGLSILYEVVHYHEGKVAIDSEVGKGTCFTVMFPANTFVSAVTTERFEIIPAV